MRLYIRLLLSIVAVVLLGVLIVAVLANQVAQREVAGLMVAGGMTTASELALQLAGYYRGQGGWDGVETLLQPGHGRGMMGGQRLIVTDARGEVVADSAGGLEGQVLSAAELAGGQPIEVDGQRVGTLLASGSGMMGPAAGMGTQGAALLARVNRAIWLAALGATLAAVVVGSLLAYGLLRPIRTLTAAAGAIASGRLSQRVAVQSRDEIGELATAFNAMAASLEKAEQLRREMTADIAHELRNPIAVLQGNLEAVVDGVLPPTAENLQPLVDQTQVLTRLVDDLRTVALAEAGQLNLQRVPTQPAALAQSAVAQFQPRAEAKGVALRLEADPDLPELMLDPQRISQVLGNLLSNALRHTPAGGKVICRVTRAGEVGKRVEAPAGAARNTAQVIFSVADTGPGIPPEALPRIFERFYRADSGRSRADGGTGLGLTIARQLVEAHGGQIWARSQPGQGAEVAFRL
jgi:signal transduction histidine kinase